MRPTSTFVLGSIRPAGRLALGLSLVVWMAACGTSNEEVDAGEDQQQDAGPQPDANDFPPPDAGEPDAGEDPPDASEPPDAGPPPEGSCGGMAGACPEGESCVFPEGSECGQKVFGTCEPTPANCPDLDEPQCGCDGATYANACEALRAGAGVSHAGACVNQACGALDAAGSGDCTDSLGFTWDGTDCVEVKGCGCVGANCDRLSPEADCRAHYMSLACLAPASCASSGECEANEYCAFPALDACGATMTGTCQTRPAECVGSAGKVCGCDGEEYESECLAWNVGVAVEYNGPCTSSAVCRAQDARGAGDGQTSHGFLWNGTACVEVIGASCVGTACGQLAATRDACETAFTEAGCLTPQTCGGAQGLTCDFGFYCDFPPTDACGLAGTCVRAPTDCPDEYAPVCGCDNQTYDSACMAARAGFVDVASEGACAAGCPAQDAVGLGGGSDVLGYRWDGQACVPLIGTACPGSVDAGFEDCDWCEGADCGAVYADKANCEYDRTQSGCLTPQPCGGSSGATCPADYYCDYPDAIGGCLVPGATGVCALRPLDCPLVGEPACGCDGQDYPTLCEALLAGVDVASTGRCDP